MRISDWSSDVCSSDLRNLVDRHHDGSRQALRRQELVYERGCGGDRPKRQMPRAGNGTGSQFDAGQRMALQHQAYIVVGVQHATLEPRRAAGDDDNRHVDLVLVQQGWQVEQSSWHYWTSVVCGYSVVVRCNIG